MGRRFLLHSLKEVDSEKVTKRVRFVALLGNKKPPIIPSGAIGCQCTHNKVYII